jgi:hypothetical protein
MKVSHKTQVEKVKGVLYTLKTMNGKPFSFKDVKVGSTYENAIRNSGLFNIQGGVINWTHPNGISDSIVNSIIKEAQVVGRRYNERAKKKNTPELAEWFNPTESYTNHGDQSILLDSIADKEQLDRIESKLDQLLNALL